MGTYLNWVAQKKADVADPSAVLFMRRLDGSSDRSLAYYETPDAVSTTPRTMQEDLHNPQRRLDEKESDSSHTL